MKSVYGPYLKERSGDHQFYLCATGKSGFKLADVIKEVKNEVTFIDVGANTGLYSLLASQCSKVSQVIAVEPNPVIVKSLKENINYNQAFKVRVLEGAISGNPKTVALHFNDWHTGKGNIGRRGENNVIVKSLNRDVLTREFAQIPGDVFLKIDTEGAECEVLEEVFSADKSSIIKYVFVEITPGWASQEKVDRIFALMRLNGFKLYWRSPGDDQYDAYFVKNKNYQLADKLKQKRLESIEKKPVYSVCVPNYNMSDTIYRAISSVAEQLNDDYEILIIDDGSSDDSKDVIRTLEADYPIVRSIFLTRDKNRHLGETRNFSFYSALGEYVLFHIDADDVWEPYLQDFVKLYHPLENAYAHEFLLSGQQVGIAKRNLMLASGGFENIYRCEDRALMLALAKQDKILFLDYKSFRVRLTRPRNKKYIKVVRDMWSHLLYDLNQKTSCRHKLQYILVALLFTYDNPHLTARTRLLRFLMVLPAWIRSLFAENLPMAMSWEDFLEYRKPRRGNFTYLMERAGHPVKLAEFVTGKAEDIFSYKMSNTGFKGE